MEKTSQNSCNFVNYANRTPVIKPIFKIDIMPLLCNFYCHKFAIIMPTVKSNRQPQLNALATRIRQTNTDFGGINGLHALLQIRPKRAVIQSRDLVAKNKSDILKALRRGHRIEDIARALSIPNRTFVRRLSELNISARLVRKQYQRSP